MRSPDSTGLGLRALIPVTAEAVLVTTDFGPGVKPVALPVNPAAGLPGKGVGTRRAGHNGTGHSPAIESMMTHRTHPMYENSPEWSGKAAFMNGAVVVRSEWDRRHRAVRARDAGPRPTSETDGAA